MNCVHLNKHKRIFLFLIFGSLKKMYLFKSEIIRWSVSPGVLLYRSYEWNILYVVYFVLIFFFYFYRPRKRTKRNKTTENRTRNRMKIGGKAPMTESNRAFLFLPFFSYCRNCENIMFSDIVLWIVKLSTK